MQQQNPRDKKKHIINKAKIAIIIGCGLVVLAIAVRIFFYVNGIKAFPLLLCLSVYASVIGIGIIWATLLFSERYKKASFYAALFGVLMGAVWFYVVVGGRNDITIEDFGQFTNAFMSVCVFLTSIGFIFKEYLETLKKKYKPIRDDVDYESNKRALAAIIGVAMLIVASFAISYLFFPKGGEIFKEDITLTKIVLFSAGIATFYWAAKANFIKAAHITEQIAEGKRRDRELALSQYRDTAQLIADSSKLLGGANYAEKYAGLAFLNDVAKDEDGKFYQQAFDIIHNFIMYEEDKTTANKPRIAAMKYFEPLYRKFEIYERKEFNNIVLKAAAKSEILEQYFDLNMEYVGFSIIRYSKSDMYYTQTFRDCDFFDGTIEGIYPINCFFLACSIKNLSSYNNTGIGYMWKYKEFEKNVLKFDFCDFSNYEQFGWFDEIETDGCFYIKGREPESIEHIPNLKVFQTSKEADAFMSGSNDT